jgi:Rrf2 family protein
MTYLATRHGEGPIRVRTVAEAEGLPAKYLEQLLARLRQAGLVRSSRGARGGIMLARAPETITAREVIATLEGSLAPVECVENRNRHAGECPTHPLWSALHNSVLTTLESFTLADLALRSRNGRDEDSKPADRPEATERVAATVAGRTDAGD